MTDATGNRAEPCPAVSPAGAGRTGMTGLVVSLAVSAIAGGGPGQAVVRERSRLTRAA